jgi:hypothetical protein
MPIRPRFDAIKEYSEEDDEEIAEQVAEIVIHVLDKTVRFLENCRRDGLTLAQAIRLFKKQRRMFLEGL